MSHGAQDWETLLPMAKRAAAGSRAEKSINAANDGRKDEARQDDWRAALREHGVALWREGAGAATAAVPDSRLLAPLGALADEALELVETFTLGSLAKARRRGTVPAKPPEDFIARLGMILKGLQPPAKGEEGNRPTAPIIFQSELWQFLRKTRESAELSYARELDLVELDRRILFLLRTQGPLVPADLSGSVGVDKAQVSRSVKRLLELRMVEREQIRSPVTLTRKGESQADRLLRLADLRNRELTFDIDDDELSGFIAAIEMLLDRSIALYEKERARTAADERRCASLLSNPFQAQRGGAQRAPSKGHDGLARLGGEAQREHRRRRRAARQDEAGGRERHHGRPQQHGRLRDRASGIARGGREDLRESSALHRLPGRSRRGDGVLARARRRSLSGRAIRSARS